MHKRKKINLYKRNKYRNYYLIEIAIIIALFIGLYPMLGVKTADMAKIKSDLEKTINLDCVNVGDEKTLKNLYYINKNDIEDFISYAPKSNMEVEEILVLKTKEGTDISEIKSKINKRLEKQGESFKNYRPEKYNIIENAVLEEEGQYLIFIVSENASAIKKIIKDNFK